MAKRNIEAELKVYFISNINNRIQSLKDEITALKSFRVKMFGKTAKPEPAAKREKSGKLRKAKTTNNIPWQHRPGNEEKAAKWRKKMADLNRGKK